MSNISAVSASLNGIAAAQAQHAAAASQIATGGDIAAGAVNASAAEASMAVNTAMLKQAMDQDKYLIDVLVQ